MAGDQAILVTFGAQYSARTSRAVLAFDAALADAPKGVIETAPTIRSVLVAFDPLVLAPDALVRWCQSLLASRNWLESDAVPGRRWEIPVVYSGASAPDLAETAHLAGLAEDELIGLHAGIDLSVLCLGFSPGLIYLAELPDQFAIPRRQSFGKPVEPGAILVANRQTVVPSTPIPTGWRQIGRTPFRSFRLDASPRFVISPGDTIRFRPVTRREAERFDHSQFAGMEDGGA